MNATSNTNLIYQNIIANSFAKHFPESYFGISKLPLSDGFCISFALGKDKTEWMNGIIQNDPLNMSCFYFAEENEFEFRASLTTTPTKPHMFSSTTKLTNVKKFTRDTIDYKHVDSYFQKVKESIRKLEPQWHEKYAALIRAKLVD